MVSEKLQNAINNVEHCVFQPVNKEHDLYLTSKKGGKNKDGVIIFPANT